MCRLPDGSLYRHLKFKSQYNRIDGVLKPDRVYRDKALKDLSKLIKNKKYWLCCISR